jgi:hypothetical protein
MIHLVITAHKRTEFFEILKKSLLNQRHTKLQIKLWFYLDKSDAQSILQHTIHQCFTDKFDLELVVRDEFKGLKINTLEAITETFQKTESSAIVHLEDDVLLCNDAIEFISSIAGMQSDFEQEIMGVSLYSQQNNPWTLFPLHFRTDSFFTRMGMPSSLGAVIFKNQWFDFYSSLTNNEYRDGKGGRLQLPQPMQSWDRTKSWKYELGLYLMSHGKYFLYPHSSFTAHLGKLGTHVSEMSNSMINGSLNRPGITYDVKQIYRMPMDSLDIYFEPSPSLFQNIFDHEILSQLEVDLYGTKPSSTVKKYWLTSKKVKKSIHSFGYEIRNPSDNILYNIPGDKFHLALSEDILGKPDYFQKQFLEALIGSQNKRNLLKYLWRKLLNT